MRLIDADALIKYMCDHCGVSCNLEDECCSNVDAVENQPTVDAVPVVRCKDCAKRGTRDCGFSFEHEFSGLEHWETDDDYCRLGVRERNNAVN